MIRSLQRSYRKYFTRKDFLISASTGVFFLCASLFINYYAGMYATDRVSNPVTDIVLSNTRAHDLDGVFIYGSILFWVFIGILCLLKPQRIPFVFKSIALFTVIRSIFISLTHIGPFPTQIVIDQTSIVSRFSFGGDLFFSGHTGLPFLMALLFWEEKALRYSMIVTSVIFGAVVLGAHLHYSIDVLAAFFITYTIFHIAEIVFRKDKEIFESSLE